MVDPKSAEVELFNQIINSLDFLEDETFTPESVRRFFTSNFVQRNLSHLYGKGINKWFPIRSTEAGELISASFPYGFTEAVSVTYTAQSAEQTKVYDNVMSYLMVINTDWNNSQISFSVDGLTYSPYIPLNVTDTWCLNLQCRSIKSKPMSGTSTWQIIAFR